MKTTVVINEKFTGLNPIQFGYENCKNRHSHGPAIREYWLLHYVVSGKGIFVKNGNPYALRAGDIFIISPFEETFYQADEQAPWSYIWIGFTTNLELKELDKAVINCPAAAIVFEDAKKCMDMEGGKSAYLASKLWELRSIILNESNTELDYAEKAKHFIKSEYMNKLSVADIAYMLGLNRSYFYSVFKDKTGLSPQEYISKVRLTKAAELMTKHNQSPSTAAISTGYTDIYTFSKMFKGYFGISPREYIKQNINDS